MASVKLFGPNKADPAITELLKHVPTDAQTVMVQCPMRNSVDRRTCQHPGWLFMTASVDNKLFIHLSQRAEGAPYTIKVTK